MEGLALKGINRIADSGFVRVRFVFNGKDYTIMIAGESDPQRAVLKRARFLKERALIQE